jgi:hypothetical protein
MSLLTRNRKTAPPDLRSDAEMLRGLQERFYELQDENDTLREQLKGNPDAKWRWMWKATRQRQALAILNRRVATQRFRLRITEQLREPITREEYLAARAAIENEQLRERIEDPA